MWQPITGEQTAAGNDVARTGPLGGRINLMAFDLGTGGRGANRISGSDCGRAMEFWPGCLRSVLQGLRRQAWAGEDQILCSPEL
jgi:hypothetical protein